MCASTRAHACTCHRQPPCPFPSLLFLLLLPPSTLTSSVNSSLFCLRVRVRVLVRVCKHTHTHTQVVSHGRMLQDEDTVRSIPAIHNRRQALHIIPKLPDSEAEDAGPHVPSSHASGGSPPTETTPTTPPPCPATTSSYQFFTSTSSTRGQLRWSTGASRCVLPAACPTLAATPPLPDVAATTKSLEETLMEAELAVSAVCMVRGRRYGGWG